MLIIGKTAGFCEGIARAVSIAEKKLNMLNGKAYCFGEIAHNKELLKKFKTKGLIIINDIKEVDSNIKDLLIRPHGIAKEVYEKAKKKGLELTDLSCPKVLLVHTLAEKYTSQDYYIFYTGEKAHPEVIGTLSFAKNNHFLIEKEEDIQKALKDFKNSKKEKAILISQTTFNIENFKIIENTLKKEVNNLTVYNTICNATRLRQDETAKISKEVRAMIIIGGKHSSNTQNLYHIAKKYCKYTIHIETKEELDISELKKYKNIGIMAGASTPQESITDVIEYLEDL